MLRKPHSSDDELFGCRRNLAIVDDNGAMNTTDEDELIAQAEQLLPDIARSLHVAVMQHPASSGFSVAQIKALAHVYQHGHGTVGELAHGLGLSMPAASELIDKLVELDYLVRAANPLDRRQVLVGLTPRALAYTEQIHALRIGQLRAAFDRLTPEERPTFVRSLRVFAEVLCLQAHELPGCPQPTHTAAEREHAATT
jgi:DNA-binding MarR family transcriptional regulator